MTTNGRVLVAAAIMIGLAACGDDDGGASASFRAPQDDASIAGGVRFDLAADGVTIEAAGEVREGAGHFHVIADAGCVDEGVGIARDADHVHLGAGQGDGVIYLAPGEHELCVQVGDGAHAATGITDTITVDVGVDDIEQWCSVIEEIDVRFEETDNNETDSDWDAQRVSYEGISRLLAQVRARLDLVDDGARSDVEGAIDWATNIATSLASASTPEAAEESMAAIWEDPAAFPTAEAWIADTCGVDIGG